MSAVAAGAAAPVFAADTADSDKLEEVVVTGSRIAQPNLTSTSPVVQVTAADVQAQGVTRIEDLLTQLPQVFASQNSTLSNASNGTATVSLRGLGAQRTLVLIDGRRMPYGAVNSSAADLNQVPTSMVERVDVLTGGASAVYGSDAIGGVVNFIMKKDFEGVQIDAQAGVFQHNNSFSGPGVKKIPEVIAGRAATNPSQFQLPPSHVTDGQSRQLNITLGINSADGKGNLTAYAGVRTNNAVLQANRDFSACTLGGESAGSFTCGGSGTSYPGRFITAATGGQTLDLTGPGNTFRPYLASRDQYNFGPLNYYQRPDTTYTAGVLGHYEFNPHAEAYTQLMFTDYQSVAQIAPGGDFGDTTALNCGNPLMSADELTKIGCSAADITANASKAVRIFRRNVEGGGRQQEFHNTTMRLLGGLKGEIATGWSYDAYVQFSRLSASNKTLNYFVTDRISKALNVVNVGGVATCQSVVDGTDTNCVPYNIFKVGGVTAAALNYLQAPGVQSGNIDQKVVSFNITGDLFTLPTSGEKTQIAFGYEGRRDSIVNTVDALQVANGLSGASGTTPLTGATKADDLYAEFRMPIVERAPGAYDLSFDAAYRNSNYGHGLKTNTYKAGLEWAPIADVRLRGSYQRAVRAPNIVELFSAQGFSLFDNNSDPCGPDKSATLAQCVATGVPALAYGDSLLDSPAGQYNKFIGGEPSLQPEVSTTKSFGVVLQPRFAPGLSLTVDYFNINITNTISTFGSINTLSACYDNNNADACARIHRDPSGSLWFGSGYVKDLNLNIGGLKTSGIDFVLNYNNIGLGAAGRLGLNITSTNLRTLVTDPGGGFAPYDCKGQFTGQCGTPNPAWRHHARLNWHTPVQGLEGALTVRYLSAVENNFQTLGLDQTWKAQTYFDLSGSWAISEKASIRGGINNVLDKDPPVSPNVGTTGNGNTFPQTYDALGRYLFLGVTYKF
jgi:outer membrane receptor protein involved in Fe transport